MLYKKRYESSVNAFHEELEILQEAIKRTKEAEDSINNLRDNYRQVIIKVESFINSIANTPKEFNIDFGTIDSNADDMRDVHNTDRYEHQVRISLNASNFMMSTGAVLLAWAGYSSKGNNSGDEDLSSYIANGSDNAIDDDSLVLSSVESEEDDNLSVPENESDIMSLIRGGAGLLGGLLLGAGTIIRPITYYTKSNEIYKEVESIKKDCARLEKYILSVEEVKTKTIDTYRVVETKLGELTYLRGADYKNLEEIEKDRLWVLKEFVENLLALLHKTIEVE